MKRIKRLLAVGAIVAASAVTYGATPALALKGLSVPGRFADVSFADREDGVG